ncbi:MAG: DUF3574 domain-containing protein [Rhizomicrobium sp.]
MKRAALALSAWLAACFAAQAETCLVRDERPMVEAQLFFGREIDGRGPVTKTEWSDFTANVIAKKFPDGFTVTDGEGSWRDPESKAAVQEDSKIVLIVAKPSHDLAAKLDDVIATYKSRFRQHSVGLITRSVCAAF